MSIFVKILKKNGEERLLTFKDSCKHLDHIMEISPLYMRDGDSLSIKWNVDVEAYTNDKLTDTSKITHYTTIEIEKPVVCKYIRLIKYGKKRKLYIYEKLPKTLKERYKNSLMTGDYDE